MGKIIDDVEVLLDLSGDDLTELLLDEKYNKANLRELLRRTVLKTKEYKKAFEYECKLHEELKERNRKFKESF